MTSQILALWGFAIIGAILLGFAAIVLWKILKGDINIADLLLEPPDPKKPELPGKASLSRFQFLIFTFVVAGLFLMLSIEAGTLIDIPTNVLVLLGISGGSYLVSKAVQQTAGKSGDQSPTQTEQQSTQSKQAGEVKKMT